MTGENLHLLKIFLNLLSGRMRGNEDKPPEFQIDETYSVPVSTSLHTTIRLYTTPSSNFNKNLWTWTRVVATWVQILSTNLHTLIRLCPTPLHYNGSRGTCTQPLHVQRFYWMMINHLMTLFIPPGCWYCGVWYVHAGCDPDERHPPAGSHVPGRVHSRLHQGDSQEEAASRGGQRGTDSIFCPQEGTHIIIY